MYKFNPFTVNLDIASDTSGFVPYIGATTSVDLGNWNLKANALTTDVGVFGGLDTVFPLALTGTFAAGGSGFSGQSVNAAGGDGDGAGNGGDINFGAGNGGDTGTGGSQHFVSGNGGATSGNGGPIVFQSGAAANGDGGPIYFFPGTGSGSNGHIYFFDSSIAPFGVKLDLSLIGTSEKTVTFQNASGTIAYLSDIPSLVGYVTETGVENISNKTLDDSNALAIKTGNLTFEDTADATKKMVYDISAITTGTTRTITWPNKSGTIGLLNGTQTWGGSQSFSDAGWTLYNITDNTKKLQFALSGITTGTTRTLTIPNASGTVALTSDIITSHASLTGLSADDHTQYLLLAGRSGGQTAIGGTGVTEVLKLQGTSGNGTATAVAIRDQVGNNGATISRIVLNNGYQAFGYRASNDVAAAASIDVASPNGVNVPALIARGNNLGANHYEFYRGAAGATGFLTEWLDTNGIKQFRQPASATGIANWVGQGNLSFNFTVANDNAGASAGVSLRVTTAGGGGSAILLSTPTVDMIQAAHTSYGTVPAYTFAAQNSITSRNDQLEWFGKRTDSYLALEYVGNNLNVAGRDLSADGLTIQNSDLAVYNANSSGGGLGTENLSEPTLPAGMTKWTATGDCSVVAGGGLLYTFSSGSGTWTQTAANMAGTLKNDTVYALTYTITGTAGTCYFQIYDPAGSSGSPVSIQSTQTSWQKFGSFASRSVSNGVSVFFFKTSKTGVPTVPLVIKAFGAAAGATFKFTAISLKEALGGDVQLGGIVKAFGATTGLKMDVNGKGTIPAINVTGTTTLASSLTGFLKASSGVVSSQTGTLPISGSFSGVGTATTTFTVTIGVTMANNTYQVNATPTDLLAAAVFYVNNKTTTTFDVVYLAGLTGTVTFDWSVFP